MNIKAIIEELRTFSVPELCDGCSRYCAMDYHIKPMAGKSKIVGLAFTIQVPSGEGGIVADALHHVKEGDVIIVAGNGDCRTSYWGDMRSKCAKLAKAEAVIVDGAFRDIEGCKEVGFPVFARAVAPTTALKNEVGSFGVSVTCGGILVNPDDIIVGDENGVCVIPQSEVLSVIEKARRKQKATEYTLNLMEATGVIHSKVIYPEEL